LLNARRRLAGGSPGGSCDGDECATTTPTLFSFTKVPSRGTLFFVRRFLPSPFLLTIVTSRFMIIFQSSQLSPHFEGSISDQRFVTCIDRHSRLRDSAMREHLPFLCMFFCIPLAFLPMKHTDIFCSTHSAYHTNHRPGLVNHSHACADASIPLHCR